MKKVIIVAIALSLLSLIGCEKDDSNPTQNMSECEKNNYGFLDLTNNSDHPYDIYIDDEFEFTMPGGTVRDDYHLNSGFHKVEVVQKEGYLVYATTEEFTFTTAKCENDYVSFP